MPRFAPRCGSPPPLQRAALGPLLLVAIGCSVQATSPNAATSSAEVHRGPTPTGRDDGRAAPPASDAVAPASPDDAPIADLGLAVVEPQPEPLPFAGQRRVSVEALLSEMESIAADMEGSDVVRADYEAFVSAHTLADTPALYRDYVRVRLTFEVTRDGGAWHLTWKITNRAPRSDAIWAQWDAFEPDGGEVSYEDSAPGDDQVGTTAFAECDELSALFAFVARGLGVDRIGLFWPTWNHVVAVWTVDGADGDPVRIVVPTSQIFLSEDDSLGTTSFDPWRQKTIYTYQRRDVKLTTTIPGSLARFFVQQARTVTTSSQLELQAVRNRRSMRLGGS